MTLWEKYQHTIFERQCASYPNDCVIITADNPYGEIQSRETNEKNSQQLYQQLKEFGTPLPIKGCSRDFIHCEQSYAIDISEPQGFTIAKQWRQNAFYKVEKGALYLMGCLIERDKVYLGLFYDRLYKKP